MGDNVNEISKISNTSIKNGKHVKKSPVTGHVYMDMGMTIRIPYLTPDTTGRARKPREVDDEQKKNYTLNNVTERDIDTIMCVTSCNRDRAVFSMFEAKGDLIEAIDSLM